MTLGFLSVGLAIATNRGGLSISCLLILGTGCEATVPGDVGAVMFRGCRPPWAREGIGDTCGQACSD